MKRAALISACLGMLWLVPGGATVPATQSKVKVVPTEQVAARVRTQQQHRLAQFIQARYQVPYAKAASIVQEAHRHAARHDLPAELILAIIAVESTFREKAVSRMGARGLMQIMPKYHPHKVKRIGGPRALFEPGKNIATGSQILGDYLVQSGGDLKKALLRYNGSLNSRSRYADKVLRVYNDMRRVSVRS